MHIYRFLKKKTILKGPLFPIFKKSSSIHKNNSALIASTILRVKNVKKTNLKCFDSYMSHSITVFPEGSFTRDLCLMRDDYSVFNNCAITKEELVFLINHLCTS